MKTVVVIMSVIISILSFIRVIFSDLAVTVGISSLGGPASGERRNDREIWETLSLGFLLNLVCQASPYPITKGDNKI